jgi:hypothetical protein
MLPFAAAGEAIADRDVDVRGVEEARERDALARAGRVGSRAGLNAGAWPVMPEALKSSRGMLLVMRSRPGLTSTASPADAEERDAAAARDAQRVRRRARQDRVVAVDVDAVARRFERDGLVAAGRSVRVRLLQRDVEEALIAAVGLAPQRAEHAAATTIRPCRRRSASRPATRSARRPCAAAAPRRARTRVRWRWRAALQRASSLWEVLAR